ncbi:hypothetical protein LCGC14_1555640 [marine sediment metagenome]|uniref:Uncharacterized protein n=1 Tax=marine sediment metagenome TaxID=412755 RepID=A0A0F9JA11_9ZZZZ
MKKYPTKQDTKKHKEQLENSLKQYILGYDKKAEFVSNYLRVLFVDLVLDLENTGIETKNAHYESFIKKLSKTKTGFPRRKK